MILSPLQSEKTITGQKKPYVTQGFGENKIFYMKPENGGTAGHPGYDFRAKPGTPLFSPIEGKVLVKDSKDKGYGLHVIISNERLRVILAHLSGVACHTDQIIRLGEPVGLTGNSGTSTAAHLHMEVLKMKGSVPEDHRDEMKGRFDFLPYMICWSGTVLQDELIYS